MKRLFSFITLIWMFLSLMTFCSGDKQNGPEPPPEPEKPIVVETSLTVDKTVITFGADSVRTTTFAVKANKDWTVESSASWLTLSPTSGKADAEIKISVSAAVNEAREKRNATITVKADDKTLQISLVQDGKMVIPGFQFEDEALKKFLMGRFDANKDGEITTDEIETVKDLDCSRQGVKSLNGIEHFVNLETLICCSNELTSLDLSKNTKIQVLKCDSNRIASIDLSKNTELKSVSCSYNELKDVKIADNQVLEFLDCSNNQLTTLDLGKCGALAEVKCFDNQLKTLLFAGNEALELLNCSGNTLETLDLGKCGALAEVDCSDNQLKTLFLGGNEVLVSLNCSGNALEALDISKNTALKSLNCSGNALTNLDISNNAALKMLDCTGNESLEKIDLAEGQAVADLKYDAETTRLQYPLPPKVYVDIPDAKFKAYLVEYFDTDKDGGISEEEALAITNIVCARRNIKSLDGISHFVNLVRLNCNGNELSSLDLGGNMSLVELDCGGNPLTELNIRKNTKLQDLRCANGRLAKLDVGQNVVLTYLDCSDNRLTALDVTNNVKLEHLNCQKNILSFLNLRKNKLLRRLICDRNPYLTQIAIERGSAIGSVSKDDAAQFVYPSYLQFENKKFEAFVLELFDLDADGRLAEFEAENVTKIDCSYMNLLSLEDLAYFENLQTLICSGNGLTELSLNKNTKLKTLVCDSNRIQRLRMVNNPELVTLDCHNNNLGQLNVTGNPELKMLDCSRNSLESLEVEKNAKLEVLLANDNNLKLYLLIENNLSLRVLDCRNNPKLSRLYVAEGQTVKDLRIDENTKVARR